MPTPAPVCRAALAEATRLWPNRNRASDGICADAAHSSTSDHNDPDRDGYCEAFDLTHDPANGCDAHALVREAVKRRDRRIKYVISNGSIWSAARAAEGWRRYSGPNPHTKHAHVSTTDAYRDDTSPWWSIDVTRPKEDDMALTDAEKDELMARVRAMNDELGRLAITVRDPSTGLGVDVDRLLATVDALSAKVDALSVGGVDVEALAERVADVLHRRLAG